MRKRFDKNDETTRLNGLITAEELKNVRRAYADGSRGDILIGLCGEERVITMLLPTQPNSIESPVIPENILQKLRAIGCDRYQRIQLLRHNMES